MENLQVHDGGNNHVIIAAAAAAGSGTIPTPKEV